MAASEWLSQESDTDWRQALVMGLATSFPIIAVALPWALVGGQGATLASCAVAALTAGVIAQQRRRGLRGFAETFGVLVGVAGLAWIGGL